VRAERARAVGLFRYSLVREAADPKLSTKQRGRLVRALAAREHEGPFDTPVRVSRASIDRWIRAWRRGGFDALVPEPRRVGPRTPAEILELAVALKKEVPGRTAAQIATILRAHAGWSPDERTLQRNFHRLDLITRPDGQPPQAFGRFEAEAPNIRWTGDALHGPTVNGRKAILFAFLDDHSRLFTGYRWARREDTVRLEAALRTGIASRGIPASIYVDNGRRSWTSNCCAPAPAWGSSSCIAGRASPPAEARSSGPSARCASSSSSRSVLAVSSTT
jgi:putative transposase